MSSARRRPRGTCAQRRRLTTSTSASSDVSGGTGLDEAIEYHVVNSLGWAHLRALQAAAVQPVRSGADCMLIAPTAGGKTEAAIFPLLSSMVEEDWRALSVLYVTP